MNSTRGDAPRVPFQLAPVCVETDTEHWAYDTEIATLEKADRPSLGVFVSLQGLLRNSDTDRDQIVLLIQIDPALT